MKISKIKNSRPGISVTENKNEEQLSRQSLLYYAPVKDGKIRLESKELEILFPKLFVEKYQENPL